MGGGGGVKFVLFSDLHLDSAFAWLGARDEQAARRQRQGLQLTLRRIVKLAADVQADALLCGGDLYEHEHFTPDTVEFVKSAFSEASPLPIYLAPGNHDWLGPASLYRQAALSSNVHIFTEDRLRPIELADGLTLWGAAHRAPANTNNFLDGFRVDRGGIHLALFHGSEQGEFPEQGKGKAPHAPFRAAQLQEVGLHHAFLGHFHRPRDAARHTCPGNPDPLSFGEDGERGAVVAIVQPDGTVLRERHRVASATAVDLVVDISGCASVQDVRDRVAAVAAGHSGIARFTLEGTLGQSVDLRLRDLDSSIGSLDAAVFRFGKIELPYDFPAIAHEQTVRGRFVQDVLDACLPDADTRSILVTGLRALDGRSDLEVD
jgi:exonuclease SbcD